MKSSLEIFVPSDFSVNSLPCPSKSSWIWERVWISLTYEPFFWFSGPEVSLSSADSEIQKWGDGLWNILQSENKIKSIVNKHLKPHFSNLV